jgi:hypothetical protein
MNGSPVRWITEKDDGMMRRSEKFQEHVLMQNDSVSRVQIEDIRKNLQDRNYMAEAVQRLAQELSIEIMETTYGIPFR